MEFEERYINLLKELVDMEELKKWDITDGQEAYEIVIEYIRAAPPVVQACWSVVEKYFNGLLAENLKLRSRETPDS